MQMYYNQYDSGQLTESKKSRDMYFKISKFFNNSVYNFLHKQNSHVVWVIIRSTKILFSDKTSKCNSAYFIKTSPRVDILIRSNANHFNPWLFQGED